MITLEYKELKAQKRSLERAYIKGRLSEHFYNSKLQSFIQQMENIQNRAAELRVRKLDQFGINGVEVREGRYIFDLNCSCGWPGIVTLEDLEIFPLGKDRRGFIYFRCPRCRSSLKFDPVSGETKTRKGVFGFLFRQHS